MSDDTACPATTRPGCELAGSAHSAAAYELELAAQPATSLFDRGQLVASRYRIERRLGGSAGAELYRAFDRELRETVALKAARGSSPSAPLVRALFSEARHTRLIRHPNVCRVHDVGVHPPSESGGGPVYFSTLELIDGVRLARVVLDGALEPCIALGIARQVLAGLEAAHHVGVQHRRLDSSRILISGPASDPIAHIIEFGLAELTELSSTEERNSGFALDLHCFGLVLLDMLTGRSAATGRPAPCPEASWHARSLAARIPPQIAEVVRRCISPKPGERFTEARGVLQSLSC